MRSDWRIEATIGLTAPLRGAAVLVRTRRLWLYAIVPTTLGAYLGFFLLLNSLAAAPAAA